MIKFAGVYKRKKFFYMFSNSRTTVGIVIATGAPIELPSDTAPAELGAHILKLSEKSEWGVPYPEDPDSVPDPVVQPLLDAAGVKSWSTFQRGALYCGILLHESTLKFRPYENRGRGGFVPMPEHDVIAIPSTSTVQEIGEALLKAIAKST